MKQPPLQNDYELNAIFPTPVYFTHRSSNFEEEEKEVKDIFSDGIHKNESNFTSDNTHIFDTKLKNLKEFCEKHINIYVKEIINPKKELDFYITQSWLNITKPGESHHIHSHGNSIISGVYYVATVEDDKINFHDFGSEVKYRMNFDIKEYNYWNSSSWFIPVEKNKLLLFPSWLPHSVDENEKATTDRISISFNTFTKGSLGSLKQLNELILR